MPPAPPPNPQPVSLPFDTMAAGARQCLPIAIGVTAYGSVWGVLAGQAGLSLAEAVAMSAFVFAGAAQFVAIDLWAAALPVGAIVIATLIVNLRFLLMTATLRPLLRNVPIRKALPRLFLVADENWALAMSEAAHGRGGAAHLLGASIVLYAGWLAGTLLGRLAGSAIDDPARYGLDFAFTAAFLALLAGMWRGRSDLLPWAVAATAATAAATWLPDKWYIVIGGLAGSLVGTLGRES